MLSDLLSRAGGVQSPVWWCLQGVVNLNSVKASINIPGGPGSSGACNQMDGRVIVLGWSSTWNQDSRQWTGDGSLVGAGRRYRSQLTGSDSQCWTDKPSPGTIRPRGALPADTRPPRSLLLPPQLHRAMSYVPFRQHTPGASRLRASAWKTVLPGSLPSPG